MCFWGLEDQANSGEGEWELFCHPSPVGGEGPLWVGGGRGAMPQRAERGASAGPRSARVQVCT